MKLGYAKWGSRAPSRMKVGSDYIFENGFTLTKGKYGQFSLKFGRSMVVFHHRRLPVDGWLLSRGRGPWEYLFFRGPEEPLRFRKLKDALDHAADVVAAKDAAVRLGLE